MPFEIRTYGDPVLSCVCKPIEKVTDNIRATAKDMIETMYEAKGVGLAATQVGATSQIFVYDIGEGPKTLLNPEIINSEGSWEHGEGCLSVPGLYFSIARAEKVVVEGRDLDWNHIHIEATGFLAKVLQHEIDHLNGKLLLSHLSEQERKAAEFKLRFESGLQNFKAPK